VQEESTTGPFVRRGRVGQEDAFTREGRVGHEEDAFVQGWCAGHDKSTIKLSSGNPIATATMTTVEEVAVAIDVNNAPHPIGWDGAVMTSKEEEEEEEGACEEGDDCDDAIAATRSIRSGIMPHTTIVCTFSHYLSALWYFFMCYIQILIRFCNSISFFTSGCWYRS
jgi:hypothetical protein